MIKSDGGTIIVTGRASTSLYRLMALRSMLGLEIKGMKMSRGVSTFSVVKREFSLRGNKQKVFEQFSEIVEAAKANHDNSV